MNIAARLVVVIAYSLDVSAEVIYKAAPRSFVGLLIVAAAIAGVFVRWG